MQSDLYRNTMQGDFCRKNVYALRYMQKILCRAIYAEKLPRAIYAEKLYAEKLPREIYAEKLHAENYTYGSA